MANNLTFNDGSLNINNITEYPNSFKRQGAFPLERFSVFGTYEALLDYAQNNPIAYVGQQLVCVDSNTNEATVYVIQKTSGDNMLAEVGKSTAGDDKSISLSTEGVLSLKGFGKEYYAYNTSTNSYNTTVTSGWIDGLQPRLRKISDTEYELAWYQPNPTTIEGFNDSIETLNNSISIIQNEFNYIQYYDDPDIVPSPESYFTVNSTGETITGLSDTGKTQTELVIPYKINNKLITNLCGIFIVVDGFHDSILAGATGEITKVVIPNSVTNIGDHAFDLNSSFTSINIPSSVTSIGDAAFANCTSLTSVTIPNGVTSIAESIFYDCTSLTSVTIPNGVTQINGYAFYNCTSLTSIIVPSSVTSIDENAFSGCTNLTIYCEQGSYAETYANTNNIPVKYTDIDSSKYLTKDNTTAYIPTADYNPATKKYVDDKAIAGGAVNIVDNLNSTSTTSALSANQGKILNDSLSTIKNNILTKDNTTEYEPSTDYNPATKKYVDDKAIAGGAVNIVDNLNSTSTTSALSANQGRVLKESLQYYGDPDIIPSPESYFTVNSIGETITITGLTDAGKTQTELVIPYSINNKIITTIGETAGIFSSNTRISTIIIPNTITNIGIGTFSSCTSLTSINIPDSIKNIASSLFSGCTSLSSINIPDSVTAIGDNAFKNCIMFSSISIPDTVTYIGSTVFDGCTNLTEIYCGQGSYADSYFTANYPDINIIYTDINKTELDKKADINNVLTKDNIIEYTPTDDYNPATKKYVDQKAIAGGTIDIVDNLTSTSTTSALSANQGRILKERLHYYGDSTIVPSDTSYFTVNSTGDTITITGLTDTGKTQTELVIPYEIDGKKITTLNSGSFGTSILDGNSVIRRVIIPNSVTSIGITALSSCKSLTSINIPNSIRNIGQSAFQSCTSLTSITIPNSVTAIEAHAFYGCTSLKSINIPNSITSIGEDAFYNCISLISIKIPNSVTSIDENAFNGYTNLTIYCEQGSYAETFANTNNIPVKYTDIDPLKYLTKDNTTEYTPTDNYNPATKKYVDSKISSIYKIKGSLNPNDDMNPYINTWSIGIPENGDVYNISDNINTTGIAGIGCSIGYENLEMPSCTYTTVGSSFGILTFTDKSIVKLIGNCKLEISTTKPVTGNSIVFNNASIMSETTVKVGINSNITSGSTCYLIGILRDRVPVKKGDNVVWIDEFGWDKLAADIDLSNYVEKDGDKVLSSNDYTNEDKIIVSKLSITTDDLGLNTLNINSNKLNITPDTTIDSRALIFTDQDNKSINTWMYQLDHNKADSIDYQDNDDIINNTLELSNNTYTQLMAVEMSTLILSIPTNITRDYECFFSFKSGNTATTITESSNSIQWIGDDCNNKIFTPQASTIYEVNVKNLGMDSDNNPVIFAKVIAYR